MQTRPEALQDDPWPSSPRRERILARLAQASIVGLVVALNAEAVLQVGFLSDDLVQLDAASRNAWTEPLVGHHLAPLLTLFYRAVNQGLLDVRSWHAIALLLHGVNCFLAYRLVDRGLGADRPVAWAAATLLAVAPAGQEALLWTAAFPYVPLLTVLLVSLAIVLETLRGHHGPVWAAGAALGLLQLLGFFIWDWALVVTPMLALAALSDSQREAARDRAREALPLLLPPFVVCTAYLLLRSSQTISLGYGLFPIGFFKANALLAAAAGMAVFPQLPKATVVALAIPTLGLLAWIALRDRGARLLVIGFYLLQLPWYLQGAPSSRYFYLSTFFVLTPLLIALRRLLRPSLALALVGLFVLIEAAWTREGATGWIQASARVDAIGQELRQLTADIDPATPVVVVNLPDHYAAASGLWAPPMWRNGLAVLRPNTTKLFTPAHAARFEPHAPVIVERDQIRTQHPNAAIFEVISWVEGGQGLYRVERFEAAR